MTCNLRGASASGKSMIALAHSGSLPEMDPAASGSQTPSLPSVASPGRPDPGCPPVAVQPPTPGRVRFSRVSERTRTFIRATLALGQSPPNAAFTSRCAPKQGSERFTGKLAPYGGQENRKSPDAPGGAPGHGREVEAWGLKPQTPALQTRCSIN